MSQCNTTENIALTAAHAQGCRVFYASLHVGGGSTEWIANSWEESGYSVNADGEPVSDVRGNTVAKFEVREIDPNNSDDLARVNEWYYGE
jgi:hypothetical protein